jgi:CRP/FNR family transcriptional regulator
MDHAGGRLARAAVESERGRASAIWPIRQLQAGATLYADGEWAHSIYEVTRGLLRLVKLLPDGRRQILEFCGRGRLVGAVDGGAYLHSAEAVSSAELRRYSRAQFDRLFAESPNFRRRIYAASRQDLVMAQHHAVLLGQCSATERLAGFLLMVADQQNTGGDAVYLRMQRRDIADYLGLSAETISRSFAALQAAGLINLGSTVRVVLEDREGLAKLVQQ